MLVFHLGRAAHAGDLSGKGAELYGGRWNLPGFPCIYTAGSRALCTLEYAVHLRLNELPDSLSITTCEIPDNGWKAFSLNDLPPGWQQRPAPRETAAFGTRLLAERKHLALRLPSVIVPDEFNYLLNPFHLRFNEVKIISITPLQFDRRIKQ
ncbi:RES family NAD+ phosphorylase [Compostibacter hankyongensis]|uniref:RES family NAD+ phosphorylase n=1 Tax=Compostibacter hankyongensis TaxID=1007089 RepID=A0ABP8FWR7_9BACT